MTALTRERHRQGMVLVILATVLFSSKGIFVKLAYQYPIEPMQLLMIRMLMAMPIYIAVLAREYNNGHCRHLRWSNFMPTVLFGISGYYLASYFDLTGLLYLPASLERLVLYSYPSLVLLLAVLFLKQRLTLALCYCLLVIYAGLVALFIEDATAVGGHAGHMLKGAGLVFIAAFAFAVYFIGSEFMLRSLPSRLFTALAMLSATTVMMAHFSWYYDWSPLLGQPLPVYGYIFLIAFFCTVIPSFLLASGIARIGAAAGSLIGSMGPVVTLLLAFVVLGEVLSPLQVTGFVLVVAGVFLLGRYQSRQVR